MMRHHRHTVIYNWIKFFQRSVAIVAVKVCHIYKGFTKKVQMIIFKTATFCASLFYWGQYFYISIVYVEWYIFIIIVCWVPSIFFLIFFCWTTPRKVFISSDSIFIVSKECVSFCQNLGSFGLLIWSFCQNFGNWNPRIREILETMLVERRIRQSKLNYGCCWKYSSRIRIE